MRTLQSIRPLRPFLLALFTLGLVLGFSQTLEAQEVPFEGVINQNDVTLRAGAGTPYYVVGKAVKGTHVTVAERIADWYKISPPAGVYSYVSKAFVDVRGNGSIGTVRQRLSVYAASINGPGESYRRQHELLTGDTVKIVGQEGSYFKIEPPKASYVYIQTQFVGPAPAKAATPSTPEVTPKATPDVTPEVSKAQDQTPEHSSPKVESTPAIAPTPEVALADTKTPEMKTPEAKTPETTTPAVVKTSDVDSAASDSTSSEATGAAKADQVVQVDQASAVANKPVPAKTVDQTPPPKHPLVVSPHLLTVEQLFYKAMELPIEKQPLQSLRGRYQALENDNTLTLGDQRVVMARLAQIDRNIGLAKAINNLDEVRKDLKPSTTILKAPVDKNPARFDAVGQLLASSVYDGKTLPRLYRLVSAGDGRTIAYLRPTGAFDVARSLGSTVGVVGQTRYDTALKLRVIDAKELVVLEPASEN